MDACDRLCRTAMYDRRMENTDLLWYLWCGPYSPLNGKDKIATFERTFLDDPEARTEQKNPYYDLWNSGETARTILTEFGVDFERGHIINGHVPVRKTKGDTPIKANGKFINIDGGLSKAYQPVTGICAGIFLARAVSRRASALRPGHRRARKRGRSLPDDHDRAVPRPASRARYRRRRGCGAAHRRSQKAARGLPQRPCAHAEPHGVRLDK